MSKGTFGSRLGVVVLLVAAVVVMAASVSVAAAPTYGGTLRVAVATNPPTLDPHATTHTAPREIGLHVFENLVTFNARYQVVPQLAAKWDISSDGKVYTFYLRKGVKFHNGKEMTAEDVKASVDRFKQYSPRRGELDDLTKVEVVNDYTVKMYLAKPSGPFLASLANPIGQLAILPKEAVEGRPLGKVDLIGTGPFKFVEWIPDRWVKLARFKDYKPEQGPASGFGGSRVAYVDEIMFIPVPEASARVAGLQTGEYDFADMLPAESVSRLSKVKGLKIVQLGPYNYPVMYLNFAGKLKDLKLRQAIQAALNMEDIMEVASSGAGRLDPGFYFREQAFYSDAGKELYNQSNPQKAKELLKEAGYKGEPLVMVTNTDYDYMYKAALVILQQLKKIGLNVKIEVYDWPGALAVRKDLSKWDLFFSGHSTRFDPSANDFYFLSKTTFFGYNNPKMDALIDKAGLTTNAEDRFKFYDDIQRIIYDDAVMIKLYDQNIFEGYQTNVNGYMPWVQIRFWNVWLDKK